MRATRFECGGIVVANLPQPVVRCCVRCGRPLEDRSINLMHPECYKAQRLGLPAVAAMVPA